MRKKEGKGAKQDEDTNEGKGKGEAKADTAKWEEEEEEEHRAATVVSIIGAVVSWRHLEAQQAISGQGPMGPFEGHSIVGLNNCGVEACTPFRRTLLWPTPPR